MRARGPLRSGPRRPPAGPRRARPPRRGAGSATARRGARTSTRAPAARNRSTIGPSSARSTCASTSIERPQEVRDRDLAAGERRRVAEEDDPCDPSRRASRPLRLRVDGRVSTARPPGRHRAQRDGGHPPALAVGRERARDPDEHPEVVHGQDLEDRRAPRPRPRTRRSPRRCPSAKAESSPPVRSLVRRRGLERREQDEQVEPETRPGRGRARSRKYWLSGWNADVAPDPRELVRPGCRPRGR